MRHQPPPSLRYCLLLVACRCHPPWGLRYLLLRCRVPPARCPPRGERHPHQLLHCEPTEQSIHDCPQRAPAWGVVLRYQPLPFQPQLRSLRLLTCQRSTPEQGQKSLFRRYHCPPMRFWSRVPLQVHIQVAYFLRSQAPWVLQCRLLPRYGLPARYSPKSQRHPCRLLWRVQRGQSSSPTSNFARSSDHFCQSA